MGRPRVPSTRSKTLLRTLLMVLHLSSAAAQFSPNDSDGIFQSRNPEASQPKNTIKHGTSKLNSSVSFGINESDIAAIFRGVAYGVTTSYSKMLPKSESTTTTPASTTTTTTTTTEAPTTTKPVLAAASEGINIQNNIEEYRDQLLDSENPLNALDDISSDISPEKLPSNENSYYSSVEGGRNPAHHNSQLYNIPQSDIPNSLVGENPNTERNYKSGESSYALSGYADKYDRDIAEPKKEVHQVVDYAWVIHVYLTGVLMGVVAAMAICCISRIHFCSPIFPRNFFVTMHVLVFLAAFLRCILLFNGSFGEAHSKLPKVLTGLLINSVPPCLTAAFALVLLVFLKATHLFILPAKYQSSFVLAVISVAHIVTSIIVDICAGLSDSESVINALRAGVQAVTAGWGMLLCLGFIFLISHLWKHEEQRSVIPKKSLQVIYVAVVVELILSCFTIYGIVTPRVTKSKEVDNTWSLWVLASCERLLEACFCVTLLVITTTFTISKCNNAKPQEQKVFTVMTSGKRDVSLGRSANVYPVTCDKSGFLNNGLLNSNLNNDGSTKSENYYSGWLDKYAGTIDSTTDFQLFNGKATSTMSTVIYPPFGSMAGPGESIDDSAKDSYITSGPESSATSYSTLSSHRHGNSPHLCYCAPVSACCPSPPNKGFPALTKQPVLLVPQYSNPQGPGSSAVQSEESTSGSSYYGSSLGSSHIYSSPQYYTCPAQSGDVAEVHINNQMLPVHLHQCSEMSPGMHSRMTANEESAHHIPSASLPVLQDIPENNARMLQQYRPKQPLPLPEFHQIPNVNVVSGVPHMPVKHQAVGVQRHPMRHPHLIHHLHPHHVVQQLDPNQSSPQALGGSPIISSSQHPNFSNIEKPDSPSSSRQDVHKPGLASSSHDSSISAVKGVTAGKRKTASPVTVSAIPAPMKSAPLDSNELIQPDEALETIGGSDCSFLNKLVRSPEGQSLTNSLELDTRRMSNSKRNPILNTAAGSPLRQQMVFDDADLQSQIV